MSGGATATLSAMTIEETRRQRFERAPVRRMVLTHRDHEILRAVHRHRLLRSTHVAALAGGSRQAVLRRLQLLFHHGYLDRPPMQLDWYARGSEPLVYALGNRGAELLAADGEVRRGVRWDTKNRRLSRPFLRHTLAVAGVMVAFEVACRRRQTVSLIQPKQILARAPSETRRQRLPFRWQVTVRAGGESHRLGVEPDRVFGLRSELAPKNRQCALFFLEADRGTMPVARKSLGQTSFRRKLLAYRETWRQEIQVRHLGIPNFRVLTVTANPERLAHLLIACRALAGAERLFLFATAEAIRQGDPLTHRWLDGRGEARPLLPRAE